MHFRSVVTLTVALAISASSPAFARDYKLRSLRITQPQARATAPGQPIGAAYIDIENTGKNPDKLISITSPIAKAAEIHSMALEGTLMKMREVPALEIAPSSKIVMARGSGYHIMLMDLKQQLKEGEKFPMTLTFEKSGKVNVSVQVEKQ